jgi:hypothetical protein
MSKPTPLPIGDRFVDPMLFRILGMGGGKLLIEAWEDAIKAYGAAEYTRAIDDCVTAMWHSYTEGPEAMEVIMDKLKDTP